MKEKRYLVAVSGGPDSMALLDMYRKKGHYLEVAHVNYHKRESAIRDEKIVEDYCNLYNITFHLFDFVDNYKGNFQKEARKQRYLFFKQILDENNLDEVLIAHQKDDVIETYFMQKEKGIEVSYYGLKRRNILYGAKIYRPLLNYQKTDLIKYCLDNNIDFGIDESNLTDHYTRNIIRHNLVEKLNLKEKNNLIKEINELNVDKNKRLKNVKKIISKGEFDIDEFLNIEDLELFLSDFLISKSKQNINEQLRQLNKADKLILENDHYYLTKEYGKIYYFKKPENYEYIFERKQDIKSADYKYFKIRKKGNDLNGVTLKDEDFPIIIRNYQKGDEIKLRFGTKKLNRYFIDNKIPLKDRLTYPVLVNSFNSAILVPNIGSDIYHYSLNHDMFMIKL